MALKTRPKRLKSAPRRSWRRFCAVSGGLLERSPFWSAQGSPGGTPAPVWDNFLKDLAWIWRSVRQRKKAFTTKKNDVVSPLQTLQDLPLQVPGLRAASKPMPTTTRRTPLWYRCPSLFSPYLEDRGPQIGLGGRRVAQKHFFE